MQYKRHKGDSPQTCPYCGKHFLCGIIYKSGRQDDPTTWLKRQCTGCGRQFYYMSCTAAYAREHNFKAVYTEEEIAMTKFTNKIEQLQAAEAVFTTLEYYTKDKADKMKYFEDKAKDDNDSNEEYDEDNYYVRSARANERQLIIFTELMGYIEKKYLN